MKTQNIESDIIITLALGMALEMIEEQFRPAPQYIREIPKISRNESCLCGSQKKFKKCCGK